MCYCHILVKEVVQLPVILQCEAPTVLVFPPFSVSFHCDDVMMYNGVDRKPKQLRQGRRHEFHLLVWSVIFLCWIILISWMTSADFSPHVTRKTGLSVNTHARTNAQTQTPSLYKRALCSLLTPGSDFLYCTPPHQIYINISCTERMTKPTFSPTNSTNTAELTVHWSHNPVYNQHLMLT